MRLIARLLIPIEALVCFGPLVGVLLIGLLASPFWLVGVRRELEALGGMASLTLNDVPRLWPWVYPLLCVVLGLVGVAGLVCAVFAIVVNYATRIWAALVKTFGFVGLLGIGAFNYPWVAGLLAGDVNLDLLFPFLFYLGLPVSASVHFWSLLSRLARSRAPISILE